MTTELIAQLRDMHKPRTERRNSCCVQCGIVWPCPTRRVLDEEPAAGPSAPADRVEVERLQDKILELEAELAKVKGLLRSENQRANDAIDREETAEQAALEAQQDRPAVLREGANGLAVLGPLDSLVSAPAAWTEAVETLRRMADQIAEDELRRKADETQQAGEGR